MQWAPYYLSFLFISLFLYMRVLIYEQLIRIMKVSSTKVLKTAVVLMESTRIYASKIPDILHYVHKIRSTTNPYLRFAAKILYTYSHRRLLIARYLFIHTTNSYTHIVFLTPPVELKHIFECVIKINYY